MKKLLITTIVSLFVISMTVSSFADDLITGLTANVRQFASISFITPSSIEGEAGYGIRSTNAITFKTVDGTAPKGWYYNSAAPLNATGANIGDPSDGKSDVGLNVKSNVKFNLSIKKISDDLDGKIGYFVEKAYNWNGTKSVEVSGVVKGTDFAGTKTWGTVLTTPTNIFVGTVPYADFSMGVSFALVPGNLAVSAYSTTITYTVTANP